MESRKYCRQGEIYSRRDIESAAERILRNNGIKGEKKIEAFISAYRCFIRDITHNDSYSKKDLGRICQMMKKKYMGHKDMNVKAGGWLFLSEIERALGINLSYDFPE